MVPPGGAEQPWGGALEGRGLAPAWVLPACTHLGRPDRDPQWTVLGREESCASGQLGRGWGGAAVSLVSWAVEGRDELTVPVHTCRGPRSEAVQWTFVASGLTELKARVFRPLT